jgi:hypothetical protein
VGGNTKECIITPARTITLERISIEKTVLNVPVDIVGHVSSYPFIIYLTHDQRSLPGELYNKEVEQGIITIDLNGTRALFESNDRSYKSLLREYLEKNISSKQWVFHPREIVAKNKVLQHLKNLPEKMQKSWQPNKKTWKPNAMIGRRDPRAISDALVDLIDDEKAVFQCQQCGTRWENYRRKGKECQKCKSHMYSIEIKT